MMEPAVIRLASSREKKIRAGYPWLQRGEFEKQANLLPGMARLEAPDGSFLAWGYLNPGRRIPFRVLTLDEDEAIDEEFFRRRLSSALEMRQRLIRGTDAFRLSHGEADGLPGLIIDFYAGHAVVQARSQAMDRLRDLWLPALIEVLEPISVMERSDMAGRKEEGLQPRMGPLLGDPPEAVDFHEDGLPLRSLIQEGLKTGFYLDQRAARRRLAAEVDPGARVLDLFSYTGAFSLHAARAGAECLAVDIHPAALQEARDGAERAGLPLRTVEANAFEWLEEAVEKPFDWIIIDPPAIAKTSDKRGSLKWAVWRLVHRAIPLLAPGGRMVVCSCTIQLSQGEMLEACRLAASDQGIQLHLEGMTYQDADHPAPLSFAEALYLKCAWLRREG
jgi:23S rRNA (cytosine1962-C5)-methyltransferase